MSTPEKKALLQALNGETPYRLPIWFLRQAGRYLPEYQAFRKNRSFLEVCMNPEVASEITLQPLRRFDLDAAIIFSDILIVAKAMGQDLTFDAGHGPVLRPMIRSASDVDRLGIQDIAKKCAFVGESLNLVKSKLEKHIALIGFAGAPFTVATYMVEGGGSKQFSEIKKLLFRTPQVFQKLIEQITNATFDYLTMQIDAGAEVLMLFDTWASALSWDDYANFVLPSLRDLLARLSERNIPLIYFPGQGGDRMHLLRDLSVQAIAIDWRTEPKQVIYALEGAPHIKALQGNFDPQLLCYGQKDVIKDRVISLCQDFAQSKSFAHILNVGHGLTPETDIEKMHWLLDAVRS